MKNLNRFKSSAPSAQGTSRKFFEFNRTPSACGLDGRPPATLSRSQSAATLALLRSSKCMHLREAPSLCFLDSKERSHIPNAPLAIKVFVEAKNTFSLLIDLEERKPSVLDEMPDKFMLMKHSFNGRLRRLNEHAQSLRPVDDFFSVANGLHGKADAKGAASIGYVTLA